jgi:hypothetical protein
MLPTLVREIGRDIGIALLVIDHSVRRIVDWETDIKNARAFFGRRKEDKIMGNPIADIQLALTILGDVRTALPIVAQAIVDVKQAFADKSDPTKASQDLANALGVLEPLINQVLTLVPPATAPAAKV